MATTVTVTVGSSVRTINYKQGGVIWQPLSQEGHARMAEAIVKLGAPFSGFLHWELHFYCRWDKAGNGGADWTKAPFDSRAPFLAWEFEIFDHPGEMYEKYLQCGNMEWILPVGIGDRHKSNEHDMTWITPEYAAAYVQYCCGEAASKTLPDGSDFATTSASYNWANLRWYRGRQDPWPFTTVICGTEPVPGWGMEQDSTNSPSYSLTDSAYAAKLKTWWDALETRFGTPLPFRVVPAGSEQLFTARTDYLFSGGNSVAPHMGRSDCGWCATNVFSPGSTNTITKLLYRASEADSADTPWWYGQVGLTGRERDSIQVYPDYADLIETEYSLPSDMSSNIYLMSHHYSTGTDADTIHSALYRGLSAMLCIRHGIKADGFWQWGQINNQYGGAVGVHYPTETSYRLNPSWWVRKLIGDGFNGKTLHSITTSGSGQATFQNTSFETGNKDAHADHVQVVGAKDGSGNLYLFALNGHDSTEYELSVSGYTLTSIDRVVGETGSYTDTHGNEGPQLGGDKHGNDLVLPPSSIARIEMAPV